MRDLAEVGVFASDSKYKLTTDFEFGGLSRGGGANQYNLEHFLTKHEFCTQGLSETLVLGVFAEFLSFCMGVFKL